MFGRIFRRKDRSLGVARKTRLYDLPLNKSAGSGFLILLIGLMTLLAMLSLGASFALDAMTARWSSGLENRMTVEIPPKAADGSIATPEALRKTTADVAQMLERSPAVARAHVLSESEINELVAPWLGEDLPMQDIPLPGLIAVDMQDSSATTLKTMEEDIRKIAPAARLDTHQSWLEDLLRFTGAIQFAASALLIVVGVTTVTAVTGAVRSRMAEHHAEVELLHLMGATDFYIMKQFRRHSLILALKGGLIGLCLGAAALGVIGWLTGELDIALVPGFSLNPLQMALLALTPLAAGGIAALATRQTVLRVLVKMP